MLITRNGMGEGDPTLQEKLLQTFFNLINESEELPGVICFYTEGIYLVTTGSQVLDTLRSLEEKGVHLVICNTCLNFYDLEDQVEVGIKGGMTDIIEAIQRADKVITI
jgi:intracellular sulfur oxidation DsrE/DsrF family protein